MKKRALSFKKGTAAASRRSTVAESIAADNPGIPMGEKMAIATNIVKGVKMRKRKL